MPKTAKTLTEKEIKALPVGQHPVGGVNGLYIRKYENSYCYFVRAGKPRKAFYLRGVLRLQEAREKARQILEKVANGIDPIEEQRQLQEQKAIKEAEAREQQRLKEATFKAVFTQYYNEVMSKELSGHKAEYDRVINHVCPFIGDIPIKEITTNDVFKVFEPLYRTQTATAVKTFIRVRKCFRYFKSRKTYGEIDNPFNEDLDSLLENAKKNKKESSNHPALPFHLIPKLFELLNNSEDLSARLLMFSILTATRSKAVRLMKWEDLNLEKKTYVIKRENDKMKAKNPRDRTIYLSEQAIKLLRNLPVTNLDNYVFPSRIKPTGEAVSFSENVFTSLIHRLNKQPELLNGLDIHDPFIMDKAGKPALITQHGTARSSFTSWTRDDETGNFKRFDPQAVQFCLLHNRKDQYNGAYDRSKMETHRREIMQAWGDFCTQQVDL